ncbi:Secretory carrier membrane protein 2 [Mycena indigotica]|uniref:Secretory carrier membrane protein 2 n=1 Tax=Mycena indigotica TaxID=2126181 RepID=A0A8H6SAR6_9AGAR|nr:Secretory carrier membrane protein 2 [Mycena indigotica]KAF7294882.1 Secretory carrier membrane protein 2 [Mycena indigotica]
MANPFASTHSLDTNPFDDPAPQQQATDARLEQLRQRELDLERREQELATKADNIRRNGRNNWPPFFPLIFHSIRDEIPEASQSLITRLYQLWLVLAATLIFNMVACILILIAGSRDGGRDVGASIGYVFFISITSFLLWYRPIYNGYMKARTSSVLLFIFLFWRVPLALQYLYVSQGFYYSWILTETFAQDHWCAKHWIGWVDSDDPNVCGSSLAVGCVFARSQQLAGRFRGWGMPFTTDRFTLTIVLLVIQWKRPKTSWPYMAQNRISLVDSLLYATHVVEDNMIALS